GQASPTRPAITGFSPVSVTRQQTLEQRVLELIEPALLDSMSFALTREVHVAGSPAHARTRDWVLGQTRSWRLTSGYEACRVCMPWPPEAVLATTAAERRRCRLAVEPLDGDPESALKQCPWVLGYSVTGEVEGE